jgi:hypothetical protein
MDAQREPIDLDRQLGGRPNTHGAGAYEYPLATRRSVAVSCLRSPRSRPRVRSWVSIPQLAGYAKGAPIVPLRSRSIEAHDRSSLRWS